MTTFTVKYYVELYSDTETASGMHVFVGEATFLDTTSSKWGSTHAAAIRIYASTKPEWLKQGRVAAAPAVSSASFRADKHGSPGVELKDGDSVSSLLHVIYKN